MGDAGGKDCPFAVKIASLSAGRHRFLDLVLVAGRPFPPFIRSCNTADLWNGVGPRPA
jgi:hypothetical protein